MFINFLKPTNLRQVHITAPGDILNCCKYPKSNINSTKATSTETVILFLFHGSHMKSKKYPNDTMTMTMHNHNAIKHKLLVCLYRSFQTMQIDETDDANIHMLYLQITCTMYVHKIYF